jgi:hypothetical protein
MIAILIHSGDLSNKHSHRAPPFFGRSFTPLHWQPKLGNANKRPNIAVNKDQRMKVNSSSEPRA